MSIRLSEGNANSDYSATEIFEPFIHDGFVSLKNDCLMLPRLILRDTGLSQSILLTNTLPSSNDSYSGSNVLIKRVDSVNYSSIIPLHNVYLASRLVSGPAKVGIKLSLPFKGVNLLL